MSKDTFVNEALALLGQRRPVESSPGTFSAPCAVEALDIERREVLQSVQPEVPQRPVEGSSRQPDPVGSWLDPSSKQSIAASIQQLIARTFSPIPPGSLISYYHQGRLRGGCDEREHGLVEEARYEGGRWHFYLSNNLIVAANKVRGVSRLDRDGQVIAAWVVSAHGLDGARDQPIAITVRRTS